MLQKLLGFLFVLLMIVGLGTAVPTPATAVPAGLTPTDWGQIQRQLPPQAVTAWEEQAKLTAGDSANLNDYFGYSVALSGNTAVIGMPLDDDGGNASGSAYVFVRSGGSWSEQAKLTASDSAADDWFGRSVALSDNTAVISAHYDDDGDIDSGSAYVFVRSGESWSEQAKLTASDAAPYVYFGWSVAVSGNTAVIGMPLDDDGGNASGSAYVFIRSGGSWSEQAKLTAGDSATDDWFGRSVALSDNTAVISAPYDDDGDTDSGSAYVFVRSGESWSEQAKLTASDAIPYAYFGWSVAVSGNTAVIGAYRDDDGGIDSGSAYVFARSGESWSEQAKLTASGSAAGDEFGISVSVSGDTAVIGAYGDDDGGSLSGSAYVFTRSGVSWSQQAKLTASDSAATDFFGFSVAVSGDTAVIGAHFDDDGRDNSGSAYIFGPSSHPLTVITSGTGSGNVVSDPSGIDCGLNCEASFAASSIITLTAVASPGSIFTGWSGDLITTTNPLPVTMNNSQTITATFALAPTPSYTIYLPLAVR